MTTELDFCTEDGDNNPMTKEENNTELDSESSKELIETTAVIFPAVFDPVRYVFAYVKKYDFKTWDECFPDKQIDLKKLVFRESWHRFLDRVSKKKYYDGMKRLLADYICSPKLLVPHAELVFNALNLVPLDKIKVVFIGQGPYVNTISVNGVEVPQAMGLCFSVPLGYPKPPSLANIYANLLEYGHVKKIPESGCLASWVLQGCLMLNSALTTYVGERIEHHQLWYQFVTDLLCYINTNCKNVVFMAWGQKAHLLCLNIDPRKHCIITSSHPSPLSFTKTYGGFQYGIGKKIQDRTRVTYPSFQSVDHFGRANKYLKSVKKTEIVWNLIDIK